MGGLAKDPTKPLRWVQGKTQKLAQWGSSTALSVVGGGSDGSAPLPTAPPPAPDMTDAAVRAAANAETTRLLMGRGRRASFLTGGAGAGYANARRKTLLGG